MYRGLEPQLSIASLGHPPASQGWGLSDLHPTMTAVIFNPCESLDLGSTNATSIPLIGHGCPEGSLLTPLGSLSLRKYDKEVAKKPTMIG